MDIAKAVRGTGLLVGLVAGQRLLSFAMNQVCLDCFPAVRLNVL